MLFKRNGKQYIWPFVTILLSLSLFVAHYLLKPTVDPSDHAWYYFVDTFFPHTGNALILVTVIAWFGGPAISKTLVKRKEDIEREIELSRRQKETATKLLNDAEKKIEGLDDELEKMRKSYGDAAAKASEVIAKDAEKNAKRLAVDAQISSELQADGAKKAFERELMQRAIDKAAAEIAARLAKEPTMGTKLIDQGIDKLEITTS